MAISILTALLFGLAPAFQATRVDLAASMKEGGRSATSGSGRARLRSALIVSEVALAFILLSGAGLLIGSFFRLQQVDTGFTSDQRHHRADYRSAQTRFPQPAQLLQYLRQFGERVRAVPGVRDVAFTNALPMEGWGDGMPFLIAGREAVDLAHRHFVLLQARQRLLFPDSADPPAARPDFHGSGSHGRAAGYGHQ